MKLPSDELQEWGRVLWDPVVRPGRELELFHLPTVRVTHLERKLGHPLLASELGETSLRRNLEKIYGGFEELYNSSGVNGAFNQGELDITPYFLESPSPLFPPNICFQNCPAQHFLGSSVH